MDSEGFFFLIPLSSILLQEFTEWWKGCPNIEQESGSHKTIKKRNEGVTRLETMDKQSFIRVEHPKE